MQMFSQVDFQAGRDGMLQSDHCTSCWYALCTRSRHEKRIAEQLNERGVTFFLPMYQTIRRWADRTKQVTLPLFPGYLFVRIRLSERLGILRVSGVVRFVGFDSSPAPVPDADIQTLQSVMKNQMSIDPHPYLKVGSRVRIQSGPLQGAEGILKRKKGVTRLVLSLDLIMRSVSVEVNAADTYKIQ